jgi:hypothetical protein
MRKPSKHCGNLKCSGCGLLCRRAIKGTAAHNFDDRNPSVDNAWAWAASEAFTTCPCKWYFVELVNGEFDDAPETDADLIGSPLRLRCEAGQPCPVTGEWSTPAVTGSRHFKQGETLPDLESDDGQTIWYLEQRAT